MDSVVKFEKLDTSYVSLVSLLRYLQSREFSGRIHVALDQYEADVFLYGSKPPSVWESDPVAGRDGREDGALDRVLVRAREPGGLIAVYERIEEPAGEDRGDGDELRENSAQLNAENETYTVAPPGDDDDWEKLLAASGKLIAAVERAVRTIDQDFATQFRSVGIDVGDDYPFLDPTVGDFEYANGRVKLRAHPAGSVYVFALAECLTRIVNRGAAEKQGMRFRERVALELALVARSQPNALGEFTPHLDRIAGAKVL